MFTVRVRFSNDVFNFANRCSMRAFVRCLNNQITADTNANELNQDIQHHENRQSLIDRIVRVDHAGEFGADRIYAGQMFVLGNSSVGSEIKHMWDQEREHLRTFENFIPKYRVRPTILLPFWNVVGFALGASTALLGKEAAMACTVAVEEVIGNHYNNQIRELMEDDAEENKELLQTISTIRDDELQHHDTAMQLNARQAPFYGAMKSVIQIGCQAAIWASERI